MLNNSGQNVFSLNFKENTARASPLNIILVLGNKITSVHHVERRYPFIPFSLIFLKRIYLKQYQMRL